MLPLDRGLSHRAGLIAALVIRMQAQKTQRGGWCSMGAFVERPLDLAHQPVVRLSFMRRLLPGHPDHERATAARSELGDFVHWGVGLEREPLTKVQPRHRLGDSCRNGGGFRKALPQHCECALRDFGGTDAWCDSTDELKIPSPHDRRAPRREAAVVPHRRVPAPSRCFELTSERTDVALGGVEESVTDGEVHVAIDFDTVDRQIRIGRRDGFADELMARHRLSDRPGQRERGSAGPDTSERLEALSEALAFGCCDSLKMRTIVDLERFDPGRELCGETRARPFIEIFAAFVQDLVQPRHHTAVFILRCHPRPPPQPLRCRPFQCSTQPRRLCSVDLHPGRDGATRAL